VICVQTPPFKRFRSSKERLEFVLCFMGREKKEKGQWVGVSKEGGFCLCSPANCGLTPFPVSPINLKWVWVAIESEEKEVL